MHGAVPIYSSRYLRAEYEGGNDRDGEKIVDDPIATLTQGWRCKGIYTNKNPSNLSNLVFELSFRVHCAAEIGALTRLAVVKGAYV